MIRFSEARLKEVFSSHWKVGWGSIAIDEIFFVQRLIELYSPKDFLEVGMASGLSGGVLAQILEWNEASTFTTIDHDDTFFADKTKQNGYLIHEIFKGEALQVKKKFFTTTPMLASLNQKYQMCFIDANHQHPWPLLDTLCVFPYLEKEKILIHHDLHLYQKQPVVRGIGPKYLFDQFPDKCRILSDANSGNIFALDLSKLANDDIEEIAIQCFYLPWSNMTPLAAPLVETLDRIFARHYSQKLVSAFHNALDRFNEKIYIK